MMISTFTVLAWLVGLSALCETAAAPAPSESVGIQVGDGSPPSQPSTHMMAESPGPPAAGPSALEVLYDPTADLVSIHANDAPLGDILKRLARITPLVVDLRDPAVSAERVTVDMSRLSLQPALKRLLQEFNAAFLYSSDATTPEPASAARLVKVVILSKKERPTRTESPVTSTQRPPGRASNAPARSEEEKPERTVTRLVSQLENLGSSGPEDFGAYLRVVDTLRDLAPGRAVDPLASLLLPGADRQVRVHAAWTLGALADERAVEPLAWTSLNDVSPLVRQTAMYSLLQIGSDRAVDAVFNMFGAGDRSLQQAIAIAVAGKGSQIARLRFAEIIAAGGVAADVIRVWQLALPSQN